MDDVTKKRVATNLDIRLDRKLIAYAAAATASGVSLLALAQPAEGEVVYTPTHVVVGAGATYILDVNNDGLADFRFGNVGRSTFGVFYVEPWGSFTNAEEVQSVGPPYPLLLNRGAKIGSGGFFYGTRGGSSYGQILAGALDGGDFGNWPNVSKRYLGLRFLVNGENHYGWARLRVRINGNQVDALLTGYAYETVANTSIRAGQTSGTYDGPLPEAGTLGALATGAAR
jgi:hypothetical protein